uniref:Uncharacterized protein n=1 Tax=Arundo donax TaxID=35708 RepID=A0A0A9A8H7_ARUDO
MRPHCCDLFAARRSYCVQRDAHRSGRRNTQRRSRRSGAIR